MMSLNFYKKLLTFAILFCGGIAFAQPANDNCSGAIEIPFAVNQAACTPTAGTTLGTNPDDQSTNPSAVCSGSWFRDDVWYKFNTGDVLPVGGLLVDVEFSNQGTAGLAFYINGCDTDASNVYSNCGNTADGLLYMFSEALAPNQDVWVRVWSTGSPTTMSADFTICVYGLEESPFPVEDVLWGENGEGAFTGGLNGWEIANTIDTCGWEPWDNGLDPRGNYGDAFLLSPTSATGTVILNSDYQDNRGGCAAPQGGTLTSPVIDLTGNEQEYLAVVFWQAFRQFGSSTFVEYSFDGGTTWEGRAVNTEVGTNASSNVDRFRYNLPFSATQGQSSMQIRFRFEPANYYFWMIDDVQILFGECVDLVAPANNFYAIAPNAQTPVSQVQEVAFLNDVANIGACDLDDVVLTATISDASGEIYSDTKNYGTLAAGTDVQNETFAMTYMMPAVVGQYTGNYSISNGMADVDSSDNSQSFSFFVTEDVFSMENGELPIVFNVNPDLWDATERKSWGVGNHYYMVNGTGPNGGRYELANFTIGYSGVAGENVGDIYDVFLLEWEDDGDGLVQDAERTIVAANSIEVEETDGVQLFDVVLEAEDGSDNVFLSGDKHYLAWVQFADSDDVLEFNFGFDDADDYGAMDLAFDTIAGRAGDPNLNRFATMWISDENLDGEYSSFGTSAIIRMKISELVTGTEDILDEENKISVYPNPTSDQINLELDLIENEKYAKVNMVDITGKTIRTFELENVQTYTATYDVSDLPAGTYMIQYISESGTRTMRFTKH